MERRDLLRHVSVLGVSGFAAGLHVGIKTTKYSKYSKKGLHVGADGAGLHVIFREQRDAGSS